MARDSASEDELKAAMDISESAVLCAIAVDDDMVLAKALTVRAQILFAANENQAGIHCSLQSLNCLRRKYGLFTEMREFFVEHNFGFGIALVDERIARGLEPSAALNILDQVKVIYEKRDYQLGLGYVLWNQADIHKTAYRMEEALTCYLRAVEILRHFQMHIAELLINLSYVYSQLNQLDEVQLCLNEADEIFRQEENELGQAGINVNRAALMRRKGQYWNLIRLYRKAHELYQRHNQINDMAFVKMNVATLLSYYRGHQDQSFALLKSAIATFDKANNKRLVAKARGYLAYIHYNMGAQKQAKELLLPIVDGNYDDVPADTLWQALYVMGSMELPEGNPIIAYEYYERAIEIVDSMRAQLRTEELIIDFLNLKPDFYGPLVSLAITTEKLTEALGWVEQAKSRAFLHLLGNVRSTFRSNMDAILLEQLDEMDTQTAILERTIASRQSLESADILDRWRQNLSDQISLRENLNRKRKIHNAEVASFINVQPLDWQEIKDALSVL